MQNVQRMWQYIHELEEWPHFSWNTDKVFPLMSEVRLIQGKLLGKMESLGFQLQNEAVLDTLVLDISKSSEIEGESLNQEQVRSSVSKKLGLDITKPIYIERNIDGLVEIMFDAIHNCHAPLSIDRLFSWHKAMFPDGRSGSHQIITGEWRKDLSGPMQVVSGALGNETIHFQAPKASILDQEMQKFIIWFNETQNLDLVLKSAIAHLWFETLHPFEDGNGRIGRVLSDMILTQSDQSIHRFYSISAQIQKDRYQYYSILEYTQKGTLDITTWLIWYLNCFKNAILASNELLSKVLNKANFWKKHQNTLFNERQMKMLNKILDGFEGNLTSSKWAKIAKCSKDSAIRDINDLVHKNVLQISESGGRSQHYFLADFQEN